MREEAGPGLMGPGSCPSSAINNLIHDLEPSMSLWISGFLPVKGGTVKYFFSVLTFSDFCVTSWV